MSSDEYFTHNPLVNVYCAIRGNSVTWIVCKSKGKTRIMITLCLYVILRSLRPSLSMQSFCISAPVFPNADLCRPSAVSAFCVSYRGESSGKDTEHTYKLSFKCQNLSKWIPYFFHFGQFVYWYSETSTPLHENTRGVVVGQRWETTHKLSLLNSH